MKKRIKIEVTYCVEYNDKPSLKHIKEVERQVLSCAISCSSGGGGSEGVYSVQPKSAKLIKGLPRPRKIV